MVSGSDGYRYKIIPKPLSCLDNSNHVPIIIYYTFIKFQRSILNSIVSTKSSTTPRLSSGIGMEGSKPKGEKSFPVTSVPKCALLILLFLSRLLRASAENSSVSIANYTVTIDESKCDMARETLTLDNMSELGVNSFHINPDMNVQSEFWRGECDYVL